MLSWLWHWIIASFNGIFQKKTITVEVIDGKFQKGERLKVVGCPGCYAKIWGRIRWFQGEINKKKENFRGSLQQTSQEIQFIFWKSPIYKQKWKQNLTSVLLWSLQKPHSLRIIHLFLRLYLHWWVERSVHTGIQMLACCTGFVEWMYTNQLCWSDLWNEKNSIYYSLWVFLSYKISLEN